jgi:hypothetical protein
MPGRKDIKVTQESDSGRNLRFYDPVAHQSMTVPQFVHKIDDEVYTGYHTRMIHGKRTPVSNPDHSKGNNLD